MSKKNNEVDKVEKDFIMIDDEKHNLEDMNENEQGMFIHIRDLSERIAHNKYMLIQLEVGKQGFVNALKESLDKSAEGDDGDGQP